jgi:hypothetical protein
MTAGCQAAPKFMIRMQASARHLVKDSIFETGQVIQSNQVIGVRSEAQSVTK